MTALPTEKEVTDYLKDKSCMVVDTNSVSRTSVLKFLTGIGFIKDKITMIDNIPEALKIIEERSPEIIMAEFNINGRSGIELLNPHLTAQPNRVLGSFFVLTQSNSMAIAAQIAELEVDGLITKPFTINGLKVTFLQGLSSKVKPTPYISELEKAKTLLRDRKYDEALTLLNSSKKKTTEPSNAFFYEGSIFEELTQLTDARTAFETGLKTNPEHFRCMNHLFKIYINDKEFDQAHAVGSKLFKMFPMSPTQIPNLTRMMIATEKFDDIYDIAEKFSKEENIDPVMTSYIAAAMAITAKHYQKAGKVDDAIKVIHRGAQLSGGSIKILRNMSQTCLAMNKTAEAEKLLKLIPESEQSSEQFHVMDLEIGDLTLPVPEIIKRGMELLKKGYKDPTIFSIVIRRSLEDKRKPELIADLQNQAKTLYPNLADQFQLGDN